MFAREGDIIAFVNPITSSTDTIGIPAAACSPNIVINNKKACLSPFLFSNEDGTLSFACIAVRNIQSGLSSLVKVGDAVTVTSTSSGASTIGEVVTGSLDVI